jgi:16S rRNA (uracil1498-N3)-methyltransferase
LLCGVIMARRRFFAPIEAFDKHTVTLAGDEARHLLDVLRLKVGDEAYVFNGEGQEFRCTVSQSKRDLAILEVCQEVLPSKPESPLNLTLAVALLKGEKFDLVVQKATELGVTEIVPVKTRYADIRLRDPLDAKKRVDRWQRIAMEAAKQSGRAKVPNVSIPVTFDSLLAEGSEAERLMFSERDGSPLQEALATETTQAVVILVGSEGGWSDEEIKSAKDSGWKIVTLGGRILRAETGAITAAVLLQYLFGDLR